MARRMELGICRCRLKAIRGRFGSAGVADWVIGIPVSRCACRGRRRGRRGRLDLGDVS